ncbi:glycosyltransferase [Flavobacterium covae]|nr:glycosyltransferase [Flavobacterium covae]QYS91378.1 glycosyltransferase [Flavobacterium covae]
MDVTILVKDKDYSHYNLNESIKIVSLDSEIKFNMNSKVQRVLEVANNLYASQKKLSVFLKNNKYDYFYLAHPLNALEFQFAKGIDESVILTEHGGVDAYNLIYKKIKQWLYPKAKCYCVPTKTDTEVYKTLGFDAVYIPHFKSPLKYEKSTLKNKIALSVGRMTEAKRQWILIDLWDKVVNFHCIKDWKLHIVGDGNLKEAYLCKIKELNLQKHVEILPPKKDVEDYYKNASLFLLASQSEGFGMVILEAMSFGLPCVSYDCPSGPRDMVENEKTGYLVPFDDFEILERSTLNLLQNPQKLKEFGVNAIEVSDGWKDEYILEKWKEILS